MASTKSNEPASEPLASFVRQCSEPAPESDELFEKQVTFARQVSDPSPKGMQVNEKKNHLKGLLQKVREHSKIDLIKALKQSALKQAAKPPWALIAIIVVFNIIGKVGDAIGPAMVGSRPLQLLFLNASNTHCILTTTTVAFVPWLLVGVFRRFCEDPLYFYAGWKYREACLGMLRDWSPDMADGFDKAENLFRKNLYVAVVVNPGATVCSLAGASRMPPLAFFTLNAGSTAAQLIAMRYICLMFPGRIDEALEMIRSYMMVLLAVMIGITAFGALPMLRKKKTE
jgi:membrane protein DedA with SNARE-associated domain